jgi:diaminopimelate epimerase
MDRGMGERLTLETLVDVREVTRAGGGLITVGMNRPRFEPAAVPALVDAPRLFDYPLEAAGRRWTITALSTGTAHTVLFVDDLPADADFMRWSPAIENHPLFLERTSVMWTRVDGPDRLTLRIWERGAGETWGCGTGACAAAVAAILQGRVRSPVTVASRGGELRIVWEEGEEIRMTGPAEVVYTGAYLL